MDAAFATVPFTDPARAETNLRLVEDLLPPGVWARLATLLAQVPDPDEALNDFERYLRDAAPPLVRYLETHPAALHYLLLVFSYSRFLSETLIHQPDLILWLHRPHGRVAGDRLERLRTPEDLREELARFRATHFDLSPSVLLARFKRREYVRIMLRDVLGLGTLAETTLELSHLADVILESALAIAEQKFSKAYGLPQYIDAAGHVRRSHMVVFSLGKLGGQELNYSSDIDLLFLYDRDGQTAGGEAGAISNSEYYARLAAAALKIITEPTAEGVVFRVDLRLRPEGSRGDIASSLNSALHYYRARARQWELQMLIKARPSAGTLELGRDFLREVQPLIFHAESRRQALDAAIEARRGMERDLRRRSASAAARNVKLSPGGIRDVEFLSQCLQRIYGSADPWLAASATGSTLVALQRLHDKGHLSGRDFFRLGTAYQFLRQVEHRLQLRDGLQVHTLPSEPRELERLARCLAIEPSLVASPGEQLLSRVERHFAEVREIYERVLERRQEWAEPAPQPESAEEAAGPPLSRLATERPAIARAALEAGWAEDPNARRGLNQFLSAAALDPALVARIERHPEWIARAARLVARSDLATAMLARHPEEIEIAAHPAPARIERALAACARPAAATVSGDGLDDLRVAERQALLALVARSVNGESRPFETFAALTHLADEVLRRAIERLARETVPGTTLETAPFAVLALGRLGSREMDVGSDADLVFVVDDSVSVDDRGPWRKLAERIVNAVSSHTRHGLLYPVDTRLRPRGTEGEIVQPVSYVENYCRAEAAGWEAITFAKGRPFAGNLALGRDLLARMHRALRERFAAGEGQALLRRELAHMRDLLEEEWRRQRVRAGLKMAPGGYHDIEYMLGYRAIVGEIETGGRNLLEQVQALEAAPPPCGIEAASAASLAAAVTLFRSADHALRIVTGRSIEHPFDRTTAARAATLLRDWGVADADRFQQAIEERRAEVIRLYESLVGTPPPES
jgi:glutamate-ammonia-ligase adenylyltransferase